MIDDVCINHLVWADNTFLLASDAHQLQTMLQDLTDAIARANFVWKDPSLEIMPCGSAGSLDAVVTVKAQGGDLVYKVVDRMVAIGVLLDSRGCSFESFEHRREKADGKFYANSSILRSRGGLRQRLQAWISTSSSAVLGAETLHLTSGLLHSARVWEMKRLRYMLRFKPKPDEGMFESNHRLSERIKKWFECFNLQFIHISILKAVFRQRGKNGT